MTNAGEKDSSDGIVIKARRRTIPQDTPGDFPDYVVDDGTAVKVYITDQALSGIRLHVAQDTHNELGGFLIGKRYERNGKNVVAISNFLPVHPETIHSVQFHFDESALQEYWKHRATYVDEYLVGWFHSHPRMGDPFMSTMDINLHNQYFREPWHISCVVGTGEWALPVGFWRIENGTLIAITEHFVHMTPTTPLGEQSRRFLRACDQTEYPLSDLSSRASSIFSSLGIDVLDLFDGKSPDAESDDEPPFVETVPTSPLIMLFEMADSLVRDGSKRARVKSVCDQLRLVRMHDQEERLIFNSGELKERIAVHESTLASITPNLSELVIADLKDNMYVPFSFTVPESGSYPFVISDISYSSDGTLWVLNDSCELMKVPPQASALRKMPSHVLRFKVNASLGGAQVDRVLATNEHLWLVSGSELSCFDLIRADADRLPFMSHFSVETSNCALFRGRDDAVFVLGVAQGDVKVWDSRGSILRSARLPDAFAGCRLTDVALASTGLYAVFDRAPFGQLLQFDEDTLELKAMYIQHQNSVDLGLISSICTDRTGRLFIRRGRGVYLKLDTGPVSPQWSAYSIGQTTTTSRAKRTVYKYMIQR